MKPITPGEILLEEFLKPMGVRQYRLAKEIGVPAQRISEIVSGKRSITADTDLRLCRFFGLSNGYWLRAQVQYAWYGFQTLGGEVGVDSEKVRHAVQNRFIHDMTFLPDKWVTMENPHVPMRDTEGGQYLFREGQTIKPAEPFVEVSMNPSLF